MRNPPPKYVYILKGRYLRRTKSLKPKTCPVCNKEWQPVTSEDKYCSRPCYYKICNKSRIGTKRSLETRIKLSEQKRGSNNPFWRGGRSSERLKKIGTMEYKDWRKSVFERDNYTCLICGERGGKLNADHIIPYFKRPDLIYSLDNGQTLCVACHHQKTKVEMKVNWVNQYTKNKI